MTIRAKRLFESVFSFSTITQGLKRSCDTMMEEVEVVKVSAEIVEVKESECSSIFADNADPERKACREEDQCDLVYEDDFIVDQDVDRDAELSNVFFDDLGPTMEDFLDVEVDANTVTIGASARSISNVLARDAMLSNASISDIRGQRKVADQHLVDAGQGMEKLSSEGNDRWALRRMNMMQVELRLDCGTYFKYLALKEQDLLLRELFAHVVKVNGDDYPSASLMNLWNCFNRIIKRRSDQRSNSGGKNVLPNDFHINNHPMFAISQMVLKATIKRSAKKGLNKRVKKVEVVIEAMEQAILRDIDRQITSSIGCQKRVAFYSMVSLRVRGGKELYDLQRMDISVEVDMSDTREFVKFVERESKNNKYTMKQMNEDRFWATYYNYKPDFVLSVKHYMRHLPPFGEGVSPDLFLNAIQNPALIVWYNHVHKLSADRAANWMKSVLRIVGIDENLLVSNRSGRATLVTRMAAQGVPDHVGMLITGHHRQDGYSRYNWTKDLKMKATTIAFDTVGLSYDDALKSVFGSFLSEKLVGSSELLKPLMAHVFDKSNMQLVLKTLGAPEDVSTKMSREVKKLPNCANALFVWHQDYDNIDWKVEMLKNPKIAKAFGRPIVAQVSRGTSMAGNFFANMHGCTFIISFVAPYKDDKENEMPMTT